jgi:hypothetical protein
MWKGKWRNRYGSILTITDDSDHRLIGTFETALPDSGFHDRSIPMIGFHQGNCIGITGGAATPAGDMLVTYTGLLRDGRLETLWFVAADAALTASKEGVPARITPLSWWRSMTTNADTFEKVD